MTGEVKVSGLKQLYYDIDTGSLTDTESSVIIVSTTQEPRWRYIDRFSDRLVLVVPAGFDIKLHQVMANDNTVNMTDHLPVGIDFSIL